MNCCCSLDEQEEHCIAADDFSIESTHYCKRMLANRANVGNVAVTVGCQQWAAKLTKISITHRRYGSRVLRHACLSVCLSVCPHGARIAQEPRVQTYQIFYACQISPCLGPSVVALALCTSDFVDDIILSHNVKCPCSVFVTVSPQSVPVLAVGGVAQWLASFVA